jgi:LmbE family N-acetylglucosaminyl deacetylase
MFNHPNHEIFIPGGQPLESALGRTTHLGIGAHPDDLEIMAIDGILHCFGAPNKWFCGVVVTDGRRSPRDGDYAKIEDEDIAKIRRNEQKMAAEVGQYSTQIMLGYQSNEVRTASDTRIVQDLVKILEVAHPEVVYTHNLADKHPTHIAVAIRTIEAIRLMAPSDRPQRLYGCEVWRDLDWLPDHLKVYFDCSESVDLQQDLLSVFESQIHAGKRYDLAAMGRRLAHATFFQSHKPDQTSHLAIGIDMTPLILDDLLSVEDFICGLIEQFKAEVIKNLETA